MEVFKNLLESRKQEYTDEQNRVRGIREVLRELKKFIEEKEKFCDDILTVCEKNIQAAEGPMNDKEEESPKNDI